MRPIHKIYTRCLAYFLVFLCITPFVDPWVHVPFYFWACHVGFPLILLIGLPVELVVMGRHLFKAPSGRGAFRFIPLLLFWLASVACALAYATENETWFGAASAVFWTLFFVTLCVRPVVDLLVWDVTADAASDPPEHRFPPSVAAWLVAISGVCMLELSFIFALRDLD